MTSGICVTGGAGYLGSVLQEMLHGRAFVVDNLHLGQANSPWMQGLITDVRNTDRLRKALRYANTGTVVHLAALREPECTQRPDEGRSVNLEGTKSVVSAAESSGVKQIIFASSCSLYGKSSSLVTEESPFQTTGVYGETKAEAEKVVMSSMIPTRVVFRFATLFGASPQMRTDTLLNQFILQAKAGEDIQLFDSEAWRPLLHVKDAAKVIAMTIDSPLGSHVVNVGYGNFRKMEIAEMVLAKHPEVKLLSIPSTGSDKRSYQVSFDKMKKFFPSPSHSPQSSIEEIEAAL